jgi:hypothetical protein
MLWQTVFYVWPSQNNAEKSRKISRSRLRGGLPRNQGSIPSSCKQCLLYPQLSDWLWGPNSLPSYIPRQLHSLNVRNVVSVSSVHIASILRIEVWMWERFLCIHTFIFRKTRDEGGMRVKEPPENTFLSTHFCARALKRLVVSSHPYNYVVPFAQKGHRSSLFAQCLFLEI